METHTLISWLDDIDHKLKNKYRKEQKTFVCKLSGETITLPEMTVCKYSPDELTAMWDRKDEIIKELIKREVIDDEGYKAYMLSETDELTPKLKMATA